MSEFDHAMQGQNIAALQSMRHHQDASSEGPGSGFGFDSSFAWFLKSGLYDYSAAITGNIDSVMQSLLNSIFPEQWLSIFSQGNPNITLLGFPVLIKPSEQGGDDGFGAEAGQMQESDGESGYGSDDDVRSFMDDYPNVNHNIMDTLGGDGHDFSHMQYSPMQDYDHAPIMPQQEEDRGYSIS
ncbi:hypothetical protein [Candidatus Mesenet endosymbiont of Phosphuga atrata]|uniref:hypothetical protein n=1 Tax=Candidatus Mesenet endosymbiont of Phosphuga atrata TaxID=3066221 RepID=UPI0030D0624C